MKSKIILIFVLLPIIAFAENYRETRNLELPAGWVAGVKRALRAW